MDEDLRLDTLDWPEPDVMTPHPLLNLCRNPGDYHYMFSCEVGSCMTHSANIRFPIARQFMGRNIHCGNWFHYNPHTQGIFIEEDGEVLARGILLRDNVNEPFSQCFYDFHAVSDSARNLIRELVYDLGYSTYDTNRDLFSRGQLTISTGFEIPAHRLNGRMYCPLPFHDSVTTDYWIAFDSAREVYEFGPMSTRPLRRPTIYQHSTYDYNGFVDAGVLGHKYW